METEIIYEDPEILLLDSLKEFEYLFKRVLIGINVHPSDIEMEKLVDIAKTISPIEPLALGVELLDPVPSSQENKKRQHKERRLR